MNRDDGLDTARGISLALAIGAAMWALILWAVW
jgi:hypothetical protein